MVSAHATSAALHHFGYLLCTAAGLRAPLPLDLLADLLHLSLLLCLPVSALQLDWVRQGYAT